MKICSSCKEENHNPKIFICTQCGEDLPRTPELERLDKILMENE